CLSKAQPEKCEVLPQLWKTILNCESTSMQCKKCNKFLPQDVMYCAYCGFALKPPVKRKGCSIQQIILVIILLIILRALSQILSEPPSSSTEPSTGNAAVIT